MLDITEVRQKFPALYSSNHETQGIFFDSAGGTQVPQQVMEDITHYFTHHNAYPSGAFKTSVECGQLIESAREAVADFLHASSTEEIIFGQNMTTLTFQISHAFSKAWGPKDEIIVTRLDHAANISPWVLAARDSGAIVRYVDINPEDCTLDLNSFRQSLSQQTRLVAITCASNAVGTINDVKHLTKMAHEVGALVFLDATHYAPHASIDVQAWQCDFLVCSAHKFFGPHLGILWGKKALLEELSPYKIKPAAETLPNRWMTGSPNNESIIGTLSAINYLASLVPVSNTQERRTLLHQSMNAIQAYEQSLTTHLLTALQSRPHIKVWGIKDTNRLMQRLPTIAISIENHPPRKIAEYLAKHRIYVWDGDFYATELAERLGLSEKGGWVRISFVHYNTSDEIDYLIRILDQMN